MSNLNTAEFVRWYRRTSHNDDKTLRVFIKKDYFTVYGKDNTEYIAETFFKSKESIRSYGSDDSNPQDKIECIFFRKQVYTPIIRDYVMRQQKAVEVYNRDAESGEWLITQRITPSNLSVGSVGEASANIISVILSVTKQIKTLAVALCNLSTRTLEIAEFIEDAQYTALSALCVAKGVKQCIFKCVSPSNSHQTQQFKRILDKNGVQLINTCGDEAKKNTFWSFMKHDTRSIAKHIHALLDTSSSKRLQTFDSRFKFALHALWAIISYEGLEQDDHTLNRYKLTENQMNSFMRLDNAALNALNLFPSLKDTLRADNSHSHSNSLYGVLNKCKSSMGDRLLAVWIRQPLVDIKQIHRRQKLIKLFVENDESRDILRDEHLKSLIDLEKLVRKLINNRSNLKDLVELYVFAERIQWIRDTLSSCIQEDDEDEDVDIDSGRTILQNEFVDPMVEMETNFNGYLAMIEQVVDLPATSKREYLIKKEFDPLLDQFDAKKRKIMREMESVRDKALTQSGVDEKALRLEKHKTYGYCLRIQKKQSKKLKKKSFKTLSAQKNCTYVTDSAGELRKLSKSCIDYERRYKERQQVIVNKTIQITKTYIPVIEKGIRVFSELDVLLSLAHVASCSPTKYILPTIYPSSQSNKFVNIKGARHPCLELTRLDDDTGVIPNDVDMNQSSLFQVITGPNMGGKSTYIRMIGVIVLMAQIGSYVPADECSLTIIDSILARVGAGDNQLRGVSTFMAEMLESASILEAATPNSLIIIDELGRGTSTYDGYGIAYAISEHIIQKLKSFCLFATHFHELSVLELKHEMAVNKHVTAHFEKEEDTLTMLYKIKKGICPQSYGIHVAELAKFPQHVIETAKKKAQQLESLSSSTISLHTYKSIQNIVAEYKQIQEHSKEKQKSQSLETFKKIIKEQINQSEELRDITSKPQHDKMEID
eukprot:186371_1